MSAELIGYGAMLGMATVAAANLRALFPQRHLRHPAPAPVLARPRSGR
jgi:hypothetical protein